MKRGLGIIREVRKEVSFCLGFFLDCSKERGISKHSLEMFWMNLEKIMLVCSIERIIGLKVFKTVCQE